MARAASSPARAPTPALRALAGHHARCRRRLRAPLRGAFARSPGSVRVPGAVACPGTPGSASANRSSPASSSENAASAADRAPRPRCPPRRRPARQGRRRAGASRSPAVAIIGWPPRSNAICACSSSPSFCSASPRYPHARLCSGLMRAASCSVAARRLGLARLQVPEREIDLDGGVVREAPARGPRRSGSRAGRGPGGSRPRRADPAPWGRGAASSARTPAPPWPRGPGSPGAARCRDRGGRGSPPARRRASTRTTAWCAPPG